MEKKPKQQPGFSEKEIGEAIKEGPITKQYLADPHKIVSSLNRLRSTEITSYLQYKQHAYMAVSLIREIGDKDLVTRQLLLDILQTTEQHASELADFLKRSSETRG